MTQTWTKKISAFRLDEEQQAPSDPNGSTLFFWGNARGTLAPRRAPSFDTKCQKSYGVTFDKSNKTEYTVNRKVVAKAWEEYQCHKARGSLSVEEYKEAREEMLGEIEQEYAEKKAQVESMDEIASYIASDDRNGIKAENYTIEAKKSFLGQIKEPERVGVFVENMDKGQIESLMQRVKADERIESTLTRTQEQCRSLIAKAQAEAKEIRAEATADRNETIAKAEQIKRNEQSIITRAREWAESVKKQYQEVADKVKELLGRKKLLENDIADLQNTQKALAPLRAEVTELKRAKDILSGELDYELTKAKFKSWSSMPFGTSYDAYRKRGELLALYKDGTIRQVGSNEHGGFDNKTLADEKKGLCTVGIMQDEERVRVPKSVLKELMQARDREKPISKSLQNFITQQTEVAKVVHDRGRSR